MNYEFYEIIPKQHCEEGVKKLPLETVSQLGKQAIFDWEIHAPEYSTIGEVVDNEVFTPHDSVDIETFQRIVTRNTKK